MIRIRPGTARSVTERRPGVLDVIVEIEGEAPSPAIAYVDLCGPVVAGDAVLLNTTARHLGLGTGGVHFVIGVEGGGRAQDPSPDARSMKLRYTPLQTSVGAVEEAGAALGALDGMPVVVAGLHSAIVPAVVALKAVAADLRVALVYSDAAALPIAFSDAVSVLRSRGLLHVTVTYGQSFGGDIEAVNKFSGLLAARGAGADVAVVAMGPGNLGTSSVFGFASIEVGEIINAATILGGRPVAVPRISDVDPRRRHRGVSHHTLTTLGRVALAPAVIAVARQEWARKEIRTALESLCPPHTVSPVDLADAESALRSEGSLLVSMGRGYDDDPAYFRSAAAAGVLATSMR